MFERSGSPGKNSIISESMDESMDCNDPGTTKDTLSDNEVNLEHDNAALRKINKRTKSAVKNDIRVDLELSLKRLEENIQDNSRLVQETLKKINTDKKEVEYIRKSLLEYQHSENDNDFEQVKKKRYKSRKLQLSQTSTSNNTEDNASKVITEDSTSKLATEEDADEDRDEGSIIYTQDWSKFEDLGKVDENEEVRREPKPPPIVLREEGKLDIVRKEAVANNIQILACRSTREGIKVFTKTSYDFRRLKKLLEGKGIQHHTYSLKEEKPLKIVIRGIPTEVKVQEVEEDLRERGFPVISAARMKRFKEELPMILINTAKNEDGKKLFNVTDVAGMKVKTEAKRKPTSSTQCFRCQLYGHVQYRCTAEYRCVRCAENHPSFECPHKDKRIKAKCALCGGDHHAASKVCPEHPQNIRERKEEERKKRLEQSKRKGVLRTLQLLRMGVNLLILTK
ncbi:associated with zinc finger [Holotrichia oblita]|uniref:Associated with zinc finger n=1 Tax=Holotrichia oblita TaxID=644536 RepID=A0ACB9T8Y9_HOLOL|nr:associated with zinc finger [Holotrichia oblita]